MKHPERVEDYFDHIAQAIQRATQYADGVGSLAAFEQSQRDQDAVIRNIEIIGEAAHRIQRDTPEFVAAHPQLPWIEMRGMRNKVHNYFDVNLTVVWNTVKDNLPRLKRQIDDLLKSAARPPAARTGTRPPPMKAPDGRMAGATHLAAAPAIRRVTTTPHPYLGFSSTFAASLTVKPSSSRISSWMNAHGCARSAQAEPGTPDGSRAACRTAWMMISVFVGSYKKAFGVKMEALLNMQARRDASRCGSARANRRQALPAPCSRAAMTAIRSGDVLAPRPRRPGV